ncbi:hypothetical protein GCM10028796_21410 [Ramlibacter monticola]|uniref:AlpA family phage regulatory protein n=1 Tax=Ramlibacter monticola TaxID=1926872 RepID=A0A936Z008_9BURK|nr:AlpA family phage regulatory protein [Ramlibacter monticola]MBL0392394.1 AlpA family phage regulatory protein [Ramlibacter monticola]
MGSTENTSIAPPPVSLMLEKSRRLLRIETVEARTGLKAGAIYQEVNAGRFPPPRQLSPLGKATAWDERDLDAWIDSRPVAEGFLPWTPLNAKPPAASPTPAEKPRVRSRNGKLIGRPRRADRATA